jgi:hypothetical protein
MCRALSLRRVQIHQRGGLFMLTVYGNDRVAVLAELSIQLVRQPTDSPLVPRTVNVYDQHSVYWPEWRLANRSAA